MAGTTTAITLCTKCCVMIIGNRVKCPWLLPMLASTGAAALIKQKGATLTRAQAAQLRVLTHAVNAQTKIQTRTACSHSAATCQSEMLLLHRIHQYCTETLGLHRTHSTHIGDKRLDEALPGVPHRLVGPRDPALKSCVGHGYCAIGEPGVCTPH